MNYELIYVGFIIGMLAGVLFMRFINSQHEKRMNKIDDDFEEWKVRRHKQFIAELDEIDRKSRNYVVYPPSEEEFKSKEYVKNPNTIDPTKVMDEIKKKRVFSPAETDRILRSERDD